MYSFHRKEGNLECPPPSPVWQIQHLWEMPGVLRTYHMVCLLPLFKALVDALKAVSEEAGGHEERTIALLISPASSG
jgi:hypothetical protein